MLAIVAGIGMMQASIINGTCGDNLIWSLNTENGILTIEGTGDMEKYSYNNRAPWENYKSSITSVEISGALAKVGNYAFYQCENLVNLTLPSSTIEIGEYAFFGCSNLESVTFPDNLTRINRCAFSHCTSLTYVLIPQSVSYIGAYAFNWCYGLTNFEVESQSPYYCVEDGILFNKYKTKLIACVLSQNISSYSIPNTVTTIDDYAFSESTLSSIEISGSVQTIGQWAFNGCYQLTSVNIADGVKTIGYKAFMWCKNLTAITIPNSVTQINEGAFDYCRELSSIYNYATTPQSIGDNVFTEVNKSTCVLYVPEESLDLYKAKKGWQDFQIRIIPEHIVNYVGKDANVIDSEVIAFNIPDAPSFSGFTFVRWDVVAGPISEGINIQAVYQADSPTSAPEVYTNPANSAQKLIRNGNVYILTDDSRTYTVTGQEVN